MEKKISVVIPTYKRYDLLKKCLSALCRQSMPKADYEIIVVSDGPDKPTEDLVTYSQFRSGCDLRYFASSEKKGPAAARNLGWRSANGTLVAFTDDDCIPNKDWLLSLWQAYRQETYVAYSGKIIVPVGERPTDYEWNTSHLETAEFVTANCCCTKNVLEAVEGFDERFTAAWREDSDLEFKILKRNIPIWKIKNAVIVHPVRKAPWGVSVKEQKKGMFNALLYKKFPDLYRKKIQTQPAVLYYAMIVSVLVAFVGLLFSLPIVAGVASLLWLALQIQFISKRLVHTSHEPGHVLEMVVTSFVIPFLSVYWQLYGAYKYKVFLL